MEGENHTAVHTLNRREKKGGWKEEGKERGLTMQYSH